MAGQIRKKRIEDHFGDGDEFEAVLKTAIHETDADNTSALDFLIQLEESWEQYGMRCNLSDAQYQWLARLAGIDD